MTTAKPPARRVRMSLRELEQEKNKELRYAFFKAWDCIKKKSHKEPDSYWAIASIYGEPFNKTRTTEPHSEKVWDGYSQNENVLFPTWNRYYLKYLEDALVKAVPDSHVVALHYWDETSTESLQHGLPKYLTDEQVQIDKNGTTIENPLLNFQLPVRISLENNGGNRHHLKPSGYVTKRYPFSGAMEEIQTNFLSRVLKRQPIQPTHETTVQNNYINSTNQLRSPTKYLQQNIVSHLQNGDKSILKLYKKCLDNTTYNAFSNILSAKLIEDSISLEEASTEMLKVLGGDLTHGLIAGAQGDLASKEIAAFDPLFFLHMCNVDRMFWKWQEKYDKKTVKKPFIISDENSDDKGLKPKFGQGPSPDQDGDVKLKMDSALDPFKNNLEKQVCSKDAIDIVDQLNYTYFGGSL